MEIDLSKLSTEQLIELYKHSSSQDAGAEYFIKLLHNKGWITNDKEGDTK